MTHVIELILVGAAFLIAVLYLGKTYLVRRKTACEKCALMKAISK